MAFLRYVNWNIEWMDKLFKDDTTIHRSTQDIADVNELCQRIAQVIIEVNADVLAILEGIFILEFCSFFLHTKFTLYFSFFLSLSFFFIFLILKGQQVC